MEKKCLVGIVSWCDSRQYPQRFKVFKKLVKSLEKYIPKEECLIAIVDNNSSPDVKTFIESSPIFDLKIMLEENIHDVGAYAVLAQIAKDNKLEYLWVLENDYVLFAKPDVKGSIQFLKSHPSCGYMRLQKFKYIDRYLYDKKLLAQKKTSNEDAVWLKNIASSEELKWKGPYHQNGRNYYITNWHFGLHGGLISLKVWETLFPNESKHTPYYYKLESFMRQKFATLGKDVAVLDGGVFSMRSPSLYQKSIKIPLIESLRESLYGAKGGYIDGSLLTYYKKNYAQYAPIQIQLFSNSLGNEEIAELKEVFASRWLGYGARSKQFETQFALMLGASNALGITSCTSGLFMSMDILNIGKGDEVIMPSIGFVGAANAVIKAGAKPIFADVDPYYFNILPTEIERLLNRKTKAIILLHYGGIPSEMDKIKNILSRHSKKVYLIEDSANSIKSLYKGKYCGTLGDIGLFSLDANKIITTGTGGVMIINDIHLLEKAKALRFYGLKPTLNSGYDAMRARRERWWEIELDYPGNRYLINDISSAIAMAQLPKLDDFIASRKKLWKHYNRTLSRIRRITTPKIPPSYTSSSYYFYWIQVQNEQEQLSLAHALVRNGIYTSFRYYPLHMINLYKQRISLPISEKIAKTTLNLPLHQNLTESQVQRIVGTIKQWSKMRRN